MAMILILIFQGVLKPRKRRRASPGQGGPKPGALKNLNKLIAFPTMPCVTFQK
jgi:hypothetical protein